MTSAPKPQEGRHGRIQVLVIKRDQLGFNDAQEGEKDRAGILAKARG